LLPITPLIQFAFAMEERAFEAHQRRMRFHAAAIDSSATCRELEQAGIMEPHFDDIQLLRFFKGLCARDVDVRGAKALSSKDDGTAEARRAPPRNSGRTRSQARLIS